MGDRRPEVWVSDLCKSQLCHPTSQYQICLAHQVRDLQYEVDTHHCQRQDYETQLDQMLDIAPHYAGSENLRGCFVQPRPALLLFLHRDDVPPTNNASEQALRNSESLYL
jgi:transposase